MSRRSSGCRWPKGPRDGHDDRDLADPRVREPADCHRMRSMPIPASFSLEIENIPSENPKDREAGSPALSAAWRPLRKLGAPSCGWGPDQRQPISAMKSSHERVRNKAAALGNRTECPVAARRAAANIRERVARPSGALPPPALITMSSFAGDHQHRARAMRAGILRPRRLRMLQIRRALGASLFEAGI